MAKMRDIELLGKDIASVHKIVSDPQYFNQAANYVLAAAKLQTPAKSGELRNSIGVTITEEANGLTAHIGTNKEYAMYVEFGTGPKGQADHNGTSPDFTPTYRQTGWLIPAESAPEIETDYPNWPSIEIKGKKYFKSLGQAAQPFLYPALKDNEKEIGDILEGGWQAAIERLTK